MHVASPVHHETSLDDTNLGFHLRTYGDKLCDVGALGAFQKENGLAEPLLSFFVATGDGFHYNLFQGQTCSGGIYPFQYVSGRWRQ